jgi:hypothetical protein
VATDQKESSVVSGGPQVSAIENEIPTYRAVSTRAVFSLLCGILSALSIAHTSFFTFSVLAIILGLTADRKIQRYPDILTGRGLAQTGAGLGMVFGLGIGTLLFVQNYLRSRSAEEFAKYYVETFRNGSLAEIYWLGMPPAQRKEMSADDVMMKLQSAEQRETMMFEMRNAGVKNLKKRLDQSKDQDLHFVKLEMQSSDGTNLYAAALLEVHGPVTPEFPAEEEYALAVLKGKSEGRKHEWWVDELRYPYNPSSYVMPEPPIDDGHGHHGHAH